MKDHNLIWTLSITQPLFSFQTKKSFKAVRQPVGGRKTTTNTWNLEEKELILFEEILKFIQSSEKVERIKDY